MFSDGIYVASLSSVLRNLLVTRCFVLQTRRSTPPLRNPDREANFFKRSKQFLIPASSFIFQLLSTHRRSEKVYRGSLSRDQPNRKLIVTVSQVIVCCTFLHGWRSRKSRRFILFSHRNGNLSNKSSAVWNFCCNFDAKS